MARTDGVALNDPAEDSERGLRLIHWYEMTGVEDPRKGQVAILTYMSTNVRGVDDNISVSSAREVAITGEETRQLERGVLPAIPVADDITARVSWPVSVWQLEVLRITVDEGNSYAASQQLSQGGQLCTPNRIPTFREGLKDRHTSLRKVDLGTDGLHDVGVV